MPDTLAALFASTHAAAYNSSAHWEAAREERRKRDEKRTAVASQCYRLNGQVRLPILLLCQYVATVPLSSLSAACRSSASYTHTVREIE